LEKIRIEEIKGSLADFFMGSLYPIVVAAFTVLAYVTSTEVIVNVVNLGLVSLALFVTRSIRPLIPVFISYLYQFSPETSIVSAEGLSWLLSGWRLLLYILSFSLLFFAIGYNFYKHGLLRRAELGKTPYPLAALILSVAFLLNGVFSEEASLASLGYGFANILTFFVFFYLFYFGLKNEDGESLCSYFAYCSAICGLVVTVNLFVYIVVSGEFMVDGVFVREIFQVGFGNVNTVGQNLAVLIPMTLYGAVKNRCPWFYIVSSIVCMCGIAVTLSRNAWIFGTLAFVASFIIGAIFGRRRRLFRILLLIGSLAVLSIAVIFGREIYELFKVNFDRGFDDNGRFNLWIYGLNEFFESPIFGKGFYGLHPYEEFGFPIMVHNTPIQLLACMGVVGLLAYAYYRYETLKPFFYRPSLEKAMLGISLLVVILGSLLDNFLFYIPHMLYYPIVLAIAFRIATWQREDEEVKLRLIK